MPASSRSAASIASSRTVVKTEAPRPNSLSLASPDGLVEIRTRQMAATGPKHSSLHDRHVRRAAGQDRRLVEPADRLARPGFCRRVTTVAPLALASSTSRMTLSRAASLTSGPISALVSPLPMRSRSCLADELLDEGIVDRHRPRKSVRPRCRPGRTCGRRRSRRRPRPHRAAHAR